ncbi:efflux transporter outer membrane subunit [Amphibiibacter pelophylacis]|uniref:Efflux transporter outer membrane subunit n=1 Tax=Amphibiibacter pelophylacis TaxID=1799477 RepID=A0ACC6P3J1_9BURK
MPSQTLTRQRRWPSSALISALAASALLAACASPAGLAPQAQALDATRLSATRSTTDLSPAAWPRQDWWTALGDAQLNSLIERALKGSPTLALAQARWREAQAAAGGVLAQSRPSVGASGGVSLTRLPTGLAPQVLDGNPKLGENALVRASWDLDLWGANAQALQAAVGQARAAEVDTHAARLALSTQVTQAYVAWAQAQVTQKLAQTGVDTATRLLALVQQRSRDGLDNAITLARSRSAQAQARQQLEASRQTVQHARLALATLIGAGPDSTLDLRAPRLDAPALLALGRRLPGDLAVGLLGRRPDLVAARWRVEAAQASVSAQKARFMPNVSLGALAGSLGSQDTLTLFSIPSLFANIGPSISLPLFDGGRLRAGLAQQDARYDQAVAQYNQTLVTALNDAVDQWQTRRALDAQIAAQQTAVDQAAKAADLARLRYREGLGNALEALDAQTAALAAQQQQQGLRQRQWQTSLALVAALGGGFATDPAR